MFRLFEIFHGRIVWEGKTIKFSLLVELTMDLDNLWTFCSYCILKYLFINITLIFIVLHWWNLKYLTLWDIYNTTLTMPNTWTSKDKEGLSFIQSVSQNSSSTISLKLHITSWQQSRVSLFMIVWTRTNITTTKW